MIRYFKVISLLLVVLSCNQDDLKTADQSADTLTPTPKNPTSGQFKTSISPVNRCSYDSETESLGSGLVLAPTTFEIYYDSLLINKLATRDMYSENEESFKDMCTKVFLPEYGIMHFVCIRETAKSFQVLVNYSDVRYFPKKKGYDFRNWEEYILESMGVRRLTLVEEDGVDPNAGPLRKLPNDNADSLSIPAGFEMFCPMEVKGDWVKVKYDCFYNREQDIEGEAYSANEYEGEPCHSYINKCKDPLTGWLRWRKGNKLLIDIMLMP